MFTILSIVYTLFNIGYQLSLTYFLIPLLFKIDLPFYLLLIIRRLSRLGGEIIESIFSHDLIHGLKLSPPSFLKSGANTS